jgi:hypothetical protein
MRPRIVASYEAVHTRPEYATFHIFGRPRTKPGRGKSTSRAPAFDAGRRRDTKMDLKVGTKVRFLECHTPPYVRAYAVGVVVHRRQFQPVAAEGTRPLRELPVWVDLAECARAGGGLGRGRFPLDPPSEHHQRGGELTGRVFVRAPLRFQPIVCVAAHFGNAKSGAYPKEIPGGRPRKPRHNDGGAFRFNHASIVMTSNGGIMGEGSRSGKTTNAPRHGEVVRL